MEMCSNVSAICVSPVPVTAGHLVNPPFADQLPSRGSPDVMLTP